MTTGLRHAPPLAPTARAVRLVNLEPPDTARWRADADGAPVCILDLEIDLRHFRHGTYRILEPTVEAGYFTPRFIRQGTFDRRSPWWTPEVLLDVLRTIVRECVAPAATEITIAGENTVKPTEPDAYDTCFAPLRLALATIERQIRMRSRDNAHAVVAYALVSGALAILDADDPPIPGSRRNPLAPPPWWRG
jgi:hypothetical protein